MAVSLELISVDQGLFLSFKQIILFYNNMCFKLFLTANLTILNSVWKLS